MAHAPTLGALLSLAPLAQLPRTGWLQAGVPSPESIADHSLGTCLVALALGPRVEPPLDVDRCVALAALHDAPEALLSDLPRTAAELLPVGAKRSAEARAARILLGPLSALAEERWDEYAAGSTREARFVRICDKLHMGIVLVARTRAGQRGLEDFAHSLEQLDCGEFQACRELRDEILADLEDRER